jgi:hypothetical protein
MHLNSVCAAALFALAVSCARTPEFPEQTPGRPDPRTAAEVTSEDVAVFEAVIAAYARSGQVVGLGAPLPGSQSLSAADVARLSSERRLEMLAHTRRCGSVPKAGWYDFSRRPLEGLQLPDRAAKDFDRRNARSVALDRFQPTYLNVIRTDQINDASVSVLLAEDRKRIVEVPGSESSGRVLVLTLPGYSRGDIAVVEIMSLAPRPYGFGSEFVFLRRTPTGWQAIAKHIGCVT